MMTSEVSPLNILIIGGSGFLSGTLATHAQSCGHSVWALTRGVRPVPQGVTALVADRRDPSAWRRALLQDDRHWDLVVDCIAYEVDDARQDIETFKDRASHLVLISTDFVYATEGRSIPIAEEGVPYQSSGYGSKKRQCEEVLLQHRGGAMAWTILRPTHIYGPGSLPGCLPLHSRDAHLLERLAGGAPLVLVGGGYFLQQPVFARDIAEICLRIPRTPAAAGGTFNVAGPETVESRSYYQTIASVLGTEATILETSASEYQRAHPDHAPFLAHRVFDLSRLAGSGLPLPGTPLGAGLREHITHLLGTG
jgi:nucleoside-diphosphate-sugar epimerase